VQEYNHNAAAHTCTFIGVEMDMIDLSTTEAKAEFTRRPVSPTHSVAGSSTGNPDVGEES